MYRQCVQKFSDTRSYSVSSERILIREAPWKFSSDLLACHCLYGLTHAPMLQEHICGLQSKHWETYCNPGNVTCCEIFLSSRLPFVNLTVWTVLPKGSFLFDEILYCDFWTCSLFHPHLPSFLASFLQPRAQPCHIQSMI